MYPGRGQIAGVVSVSKSAADKLQVSQRRNTHYVYYLFKLLDYNYYLTGLLVVYVHVIWCVDGVTYNN